MPINITSCFAQNKTVRPLSNILPTYDQGKASLESWEGKSLESLAQWLRTWNLVKFQSRYSARLNCSAMNQVTGRSKLLIQWRTKQETQSKVHLCDILTSRNADSENDTHYTHFFSVDKGKFIRVMVFVIFLVNWGTQFCPYFFFKIQLLYMARSANSWCLPKKVVTPVGSFGNVKWNMLNRWSCSKQSSSCLKWQVTIGFSNESKSLRNICTYVKLSIGKKIFPFFLLVKRAFD